MSTATAHLNVISLITFRFMVALKYPIAVDLFSCIANDVGESCNSEAILYSY